MPNWCKNILKIKANGEKVLEVLELIRDENGDMTFEKLLPTPKELLVEPSPQRDKEKAKKFQEKYGADDWYSWRCKNWGCKWDAGESGFYTEDGYQMVTFETPWSPPIKFFEELSKKFGKMEFVLQFADESEISAPLGEETFKNGSHVGIDMDGDEKFARRIWAEEFVDL